MRQPGDTPIAGPSEFDLLRDVGDRLAFCIARYRRMVDQLDVIAPGIMRDDIEILSSQLAYVARRMQDLLVQQDAVRRDRKQKYVAEKARKTYEDATTQSGAPAAG